MEKPKEGAYIYGLYMEGARWDFDKHLIASSKPKELFILMPLIHIIPTPDRE